jgi:putative tryptophan/tyrosine transport system substrate-binding protein
MVPVRRRAFIGLIFSSAAIWPLPSRAQQTAKLYRIGYLGMTSHAAYAREIGALLTSLRQLGYEEGKNIAIHYQFAGGHYDRLPALAAELVKLKLDVLLTHSTPGAHAASQATSTIPIVVMAAADLVSTGLVPSVARPGGNLTGLTFFFSELCAKRVELIKEAVPGLRRLGVLVNPANRSGEIALTAMQGTARSLRVELLTSDVRAEDEIADAFAMLISQGAQALTFIEDGLLNSNARYIAQLATQNRLPMIGEKSAMEGGALMAYAADRYDLWFRTAFFVDKILKGMRPADLPIDQAVKFELIINLATAKALGVELPTSILLRASEVIQ